MLDVRLQDGNGITACREIRSRHPRTACLMLTSFADDEALFQAIMAGAAGYVLKQIRSSDLVDAVRRVAAGQQLLDPAVTARVMERLRKGPEEDELIARLSPQERQVLVAAGRRADEPSDRRAALPGREDDQELRHVGAVEDGHDPAHRGRRLRRPPPRPADASVDLTAEPVRASASTVLIAGTELSRSLRIVDPSPPVTDRSRRRSTATTVPTSGAGDLRLYRCRGGGRMVVA